MNILLLTDIPPCENYTAGIMLSQLIDFIPDVSILCITVQNQQINPDYIDRANIAYVVIDKPRESAKYNLPKFMTNLASLVIEAYSSLVLSRKIVNKIDAVARKTNPDLIWCTLEGQTMIRLALPVANRLHIPLVTQVWDPPTWWLRENNVHPLFRRRILRQFDKTIRRSRCCGTASWAMAEHYINKYNTKSIPIMPCIAPHDIVAPAMSPTSRDQLVIGIAGQIYAKREWDALIMALDQNQWVIQGRKVRIRLIGPYVFLHSHSPQNIEYLGWHSQSMAIRLLSESDILYCPYWHDNEFKAEAELCFPSKLSTYLASGRPVLFHGPNYSSPAKFISENNAGIVCNSLTPSTIVGCFHKALDPAMYKKLAENGSLAVRNNLTTTTMRENFINFISQIR